VFLAFFVCFFAVLMLTPSTNGRTHKVCATCSCTLIYPPKHGRGEQEISVRSVQLSGQWGNRLRLTTLSVRAELMADCYEIIHLWLT
jgi:hypothetical protein